MGKNFEAHFKKFIESFWENRHKNRSPYEKLKVSFIKELFNVGVIDLLGQDGATKQLGSETMV